MTELQLIKVLTVLNVIAVAVLIANTMHHW